MHSLHSFLLYGVYSVIVIQGMINGAVNDARALDIRYIIIIFFFVFGLLFQFSLQSLCCISDAELSIWQQIFFWIVNQSLIFILPDQEGAGQH